MKNRFEKYDRVIVNCKNKEEFVALCCEIEESRKENYGDEYFKKGVGVAITMKNGQWSGYSNSDYYLTDRDYEDHKQINYSDLNKNNMIRNNKNIKDLVPKDTQDLMEGGIISQDLVLTEEGEYELKAILFTQNKAALVKVAQDKIKAAKKVT